MEQTNIVETEVRELIDAVRKGNNGAPHPLAETMAVGALVGPHQRRLAKALPYPWEDTFERVRQIRKAGVFVGRQIHASEGWEDDIAFWLDVLAVEGLVSRIYYEKDE